MVYSIKANIIFNSMKGHLRHITIFYMDLRNSWALYSRFWKIIYSAIQTFLKSSILWMNLHWEDENFGLGLLLSCIFCILREREREWWYFSFILNQVRELQKTWYVSPKMGTGGRQIHALVPVSHLEKSKVRNCLWVIHSSKVKMVVMGAGWGSWGVL